MVKYLYSCENDRHSTWLTQADLDAREKNAVPARLECERCGAGSLMVLDMIVTEPSMYATPSGWNRTTR